MISAQDFDLLELSWENLGGIQLCLSIHTARCLSGQCKMFWPLLELIKEILSLFFVQNSAITLIDFCQNAQKHFATQRSLTLEGWNSSLPTEEEKQEMRALLTRLYYMPTFEGKVLPLTDYPSLVPWINISRVQNYMVIHEKIPPDGQLFPRNWGLLALCEATTCSRILHHSAVHFDSEGPIYEEAVHVAQHTKSRSVTLHGASRYAVKGNPSSLCQSKYTISDGAHNTNTMFHVSVFPIRTVIQLWSSTLLELSLSRNEDYVFIQWHGMAETTCLSATAFASSGTHNSLVYGESSIAVRIKNEFNAVASPLLCAVPPDDTKCKLIAGDNPLGRLINAVAPKNVCMEKAKDENIKGRFLHIEQKQKARVALDGWTMSIERVFPEIKPTRLKTELV